MPLLTRKSQILLKKETTEGTIASSIGAANGAFNIFEASFSSDTEQFERNPFRSSVGSRASIPGVKTATIGYTTELVGSGSLGTEPPFGPALEACGLRKYTTEILTFSNASSGPFVAGETLEEGGSGTYTGTIRAVEMTASDAGKLYVETSSAYPASGTTTFTGSSSGASFARADGAHGSDTCFVYATTSTYSPSSAYSASLEYRNDGVRHRIIGARGNCTLRASTGQPVQMLFEFTGSRLATDDQAMQTGISFPTNTPPTLLSAAFKTHDYSAVIDNVEISTGNDLQVRRSINASSGITSTQIVSRAITGSIDPEMTTVATLDWFGKLDANTEGVTSFTVGSSTGNKFFIIGANSQFSGITPGERNGISTASIDLAFNESTIGDDDFQIVCL